jgi:hypothetical protein
MSTPIAPKGACHLIGPLFKKPPISSPVLEVMNLIAAAARNRHGHRDATMVLVARMANIPRYLEPGFWLFWLDLSPYM